SNGNGAGGNSPSGQGVALVADLHEAEAICGSDEAGRARLRIFEERSELSVCALTRADLDERADDAAHHLGEEGVRLDVEEREFVSRANVSRGRRLLVLKAATCPFACTPASVRPASATLMDSPVRLRRACSSAPCTVGALACSWEPA